MNFPRILTTLLLAAVVSISAMAQDHGTKDEAKSLANAALAHIKKVGPEQAYKDFSTDKAAWNKKDLYVSVGISAGDAKGTVLAHGTNDKLIGKNLIDLKDQNGKLFVQEQVNVANKGEGWVDYDWSNPVTKKIESKSSYLKHIPGMDAFVMVGIYR